jgi:hypothetical protein
VDRDTDEIEGVAELILEESPVREVDRIVHVREEGERRGARLELGDVVEAPRLAANRRSVMRLDRALENRVELGGAEAAAVAFDDRVDLRKDLLDAAPGLCRDELEWRVREELELEANLLFEPLVVVGTVLLGIPLVDEDHRGFARVFGVARDRGVL